MDLGLKGKVALVTGASRGIGLAIATGLAREGCDLALCARTEDVLTAAAERRPEGAPGPRMPCRVGRAVVRHDELDVARSGTGGPW